MRRIAKSNRIVAGRAFLDPNRRVEFFAVQSAFLDALPAIAADCLNDLYWIHPIVTRIVEAKMRGREPEDDDVTEAEERLVSWSHRWGRGVDWFTRAGLDTLMTLAEVQVNDPSAVIESKKIFTADGLPFRRRDEAGIRSLILSLNPEWEEIGGRIHIEVNGQWLPVFEKRSIVFDRMVEAYKAKLNEQFDAIEERFSTELPPSTTFTPHHIEWTIRHVVLGEPKRSIARALLEEHNQCNPEHPKSAEDFTSTVRSGIDRIGTVLGFERQSSIEERKKRRTRGHRPSDAPHIVKIPRHNKTAD